MTSVPILETTRLVLRGHTASDFEAVLALWSDPIVTAHITRRASTPEEAWSRLLRYRGHWTLLNFGYWAVIDRATGGLIGEMGLADYHRDLDPPLGDVPELGWVLAPGHHGKGYATEALMAILDWASHHLPGPEICCIIDPDNLASIRLAGRLGFEHKARLNYRGEPTDLYRLRLKDVVGGSRSP
jgi:RimJ/RimL family protein N-acetyltransferase